MLTIWDTAGEEHFRTLTSSYYKGCHGVLLVYDVTRRESFDGLQAWLDEVGFYASSPRIAKVLVGNKLDEAWLDHDEEGAAGTAVAAGGGGLEVRRAGCRAVAAAEAAAFAAHHGMGYCETSAKSSDGVQAAVEWVVQQVCSHAGPSSAARCSSRVSNSA